MADISLGLDWTGEGLGFEGETSRGLELRFDGDASVSATPMEALLGSIAACMAIDVVMILEKSRVPVRKLRIEAEGDRATEMPRRFTAVRLVYRVDGPGEGDGEKLQRAIDLSKDKYCSVLHTLRSDLDLEIRIERD